MMVANPGLSATIGSVSYYDSTGAYERSFTKPYSEAPAQKIDNEVQRIVAEAHKSTEDILLHKRKELDSLRKYCWKKK